MMFDVHWEPAGFSRMQEYVLAQPALKAGFMYTLETMTMEIHRDGDTWGESRGGNYRLGFVSVLSVLLRIDRSLRLARVVDVALLPRYRTS